MLVGMLACCCPSMNDEDAVLARKQTDDENEDDSGARILMRRFCHRYDNKDRMLECLWSCVDERDVLLPPGRSWCRKPSDPPHTHPSRLLCQMPVSRASRYNTQHTGTNLWLWTGGFNVCVPLYFFYPLQTPRLLAILLSKSQEVVHGWLDTLK